MIRFVEIDADELAAHPDALMDMHARKYQGLHIRGVFDAETMQSVASSLDDAGRYFSGDAARQFLAAATTETRGMIILGDSISRKTAQYFDHAATFCDGCDRIFGATNWRERIHAMFTSVAGERPVAVARARDGRSYGTATIRLLEPGCDLLVHCGNYFYTWDSYAELQPLLDTSQQLSFFVVLRAPEAGGELAVFDADYTRDDYPRDEATGMWDGDAIERDFPATIVRPEVGDMILFDGGRYFHRIRTVEGQRSRLTLGGFLAFSVDHRRVLHWA
jgi:hapalindole-type alkaloid chlorinase